MARPAPPPSAARVVRLRVEILGDRCTPSAVAPDAPSPESPWWSPAAAAALTAVPTLPPQGPLLVVPADMVAGWDVTVDWGDGVRTPGVLLPGPGRTAEVWAGRELPPGVTHDVTLTLTDPADPGDAGLVFHTEYVSNTGPGAAEGPDVDPPLFQLPPPPGGTMADPPPAPAGPDGTPAPVAEPARFSPPRGPTPATAPFLPPRSESPFRAGEVRVLAAMSHPPGPRPPAAPPEDWAAERVQVGDGLPRNGVATAGLGDVDHAGVTAGEFEGGAGPAAPGHGGVGRSAATWSGAAPVGRPGTRAGADPPRPTTVAASVGTAEAGDPAVPPAPPTRGGHGRAATPHTPTGAEALDPPPGSRELLAALAASPPPEAVFADGPADEGGPSALYDRSFRWLERGMVVLATAAAGYLTLLRTDESVAGDRHPSAVPGRDPVPG